jgi:hypothetical protein
LCALALLTGCGRELAAAERGVMSGRIFISHSAPDTELGTDIAQFLQGMIEGAQVSCSSMPGPVPAGRDASLAGLKEQLEDAGVVVGLITPSALGSGEVPFQLGAAWALGKRLVLLLGPEANASELYVPIGRAETVVLGPEALLELADSLARDARLIAEMGASARAVLARLFPDFPGLDRESSERLVAAPRDDISTQPQWPVNANGEQVRPERAARRGGRLPSCGASLQAGRAISDCVFHRSAGGRFADELDLPFGAFLVSLGTDWSALRNLDDLDVWVEAAENVLAKLDASQRHVRYFYEIGFQLSTLINLAHDALEHGEDEGAGGLQERWERAFDALRQSALQAEVAPEAVDPLRPMLENLYGPRDHRDVANLGRVQDCVREFAARADAAALAASA